jgi:hypothetical protein
VYDSAAVQLHGRDATANFEQADDEVVIPAGVTERVPQSPKKDHNASSASSYDLGEDSTSHVAAAASPTSVLRAFPPSATAFSAYNKSKKPMASPTSVLRVFPPSATASSACNKSKKLVASPTSVLCTFPPTTSSTA